MAFVITQMAFESSFCMYSLLNGYKTLLLKGTFYLGLK